VIVLNSNDTWGTVISDLVRRGELTSNDVALIVAVLAEKLKEIGDVANIQHEALIGELIQLPALIKIHFQGR
jgi:hypothetical protein